MESLGKWKMEHHDDAPSSMCPPSQTALAKSLCLPSLVNFERLVRNKVFPRPGVLEHMAELG